LIFSIYFFPSFLPSLIEVYGGSIQIWNCI